MVVVAAAPAMVVVAAAPAMVVVAAAPAMVVVAAPVPTPTVVVVVAPTPHTKRTHHAPKTNPPETLCTAIYLTNCSDR
eukprot:1498901-Rhodomonas_salina.1